MTSLSHVGVFPGPKFWAGVTFHTRFPLALIVRHDHLLSFIFVCHVIVQLTLRCLDRAF